MSAVFSAEDPPAAVAAIVAAESAWVPDWRRIVTVALVGVLPGLLVLGTVPPPGSACVAAAMAMISRLALAGASRRLHRDSTRAAVRHTRQAVLTTYVATGLLTVAALPRSWPEPASALAVTVSLAVIVAQHRPTISSARAAVSVEWLEAAAVMAVLPTLAVATMRWWQ